jgi:hypothetical protein
MIDKIKLLDKAISLGSKKTLLDLEEILNQYNIEELIKIKSNAFRLEIWDKESSINGINATTILDSRQYEIDQVYLIYVDNQLVYLQDHNPNESGFIKMTTENIKEIANKFIENKASQLVLDDIYNTIIKKMLE